MEHDAFLTDELMDDDGVPEGFAPGEVPGRGAVDATDSEGKYKYFTKKEPAWKQSDIETDPDNGLRFQYWDVGMTRNAKAANRKRMKVYVEPVPHLVIPQDVPIRGWYQSKFERPTVRPRPCFTDALLTQPYGGYCSVGCLFCLAGETLIDTPLGPRQIDSLKVGEMVCGRDERGVVETEIVAIATRSVGQYYRLRTEAGEFRVTGNHPVFVLGKGWTPVEDLRDGEEIETAALPNLRGDPVGIEVSRLLRQGGLPVPALERDDRKQERESSEENASLLQELQGTNSLPLEDLLRQAGVRKDLQGISSKGETPIGRNSSEDEKAEVGGDQGEDAEGVSGSPRQSGEGAAEVAGVEEETYGATPRRQDGLLHFQAEALCSAGRADGEMPLGVGVVNAPLARRAQYPLGVRAGSPRPGRRNLSTGSFAIRYDAISRSEGLLSSRATREVEEVSGRLPHRFMGESRARNAWGARVLSKELVVAPLTVWDIQTTAENFFAGGHLFHNCYLNNGVRGYRGSGLTTVDPSYPDKIRKQVGGMRTATAFYLSSFTDPFNPLEKIYGNTKKTATIALDNNLPMFFLTRQEAPSWVFDYLKENKYSYMQFSINTSKPDDWAKLSPRAVPLETMFDQVEAFHKAGIYVSIQVNPIVAGVVSNKDIVELIHILAQRGADHLIFKFVEIVYSSRTQMVANVKSRFKGGRGEDFDSLFTQTIGGFYTINEDYRKMALERFSRECKKAGVTMALCYEYEYARDEKGEIIDKTGVSMGARYLTADQCHGHRVPVFTRDSTDEPWREIKGCPPAGCLTCSEHYEDRGAKSVPCHNEYLASAPAWTPRDLKMVASPKPGSEEYFEAVKAKHKRFTLPLAGEGGGCGDSCSH